MKNYIDSEDNARAGKSKTVSFTIPVSELGFYADGPQKIVEEGVFAVSVGGSIASFAMRKSFLSPLRKMT